MGGFPGAPANLLDAAAQEFHPTVCAPYPLQPLPHQLYCPHPYPAMPVPAPQMAMLQPVPPMAMAMAPQPGYTLPTTTPVVDGPSSRVVVLCLVPPHAKERDVAQAMAPFGAIRSVDACAVASEGVATVHFFDFRAAELAVACVREQHMRQQSRLGQLYAAAAVPPAWAPAPPTPQAWDWPHPHPNDDGRGLVLGQAVWAHFAPGADDGENRGSLVVLSPLPGVSVADLRQVFQAFGTRHRPSRPTRHFVFPRSFLVFPAAIVLARPRVRRGLKGCEGVGAPAQPQVHRLLRHARRRARARRAQRPGALRPPPHHRVHAPFRPRAPQVNNTTPQFSVQSASLPITLWAAEFLPCACRS